MDAGWCWKIGVEGEDHRGYVFSSAFLTEEQATAEMRAKNPGMGEPWTVRFRSGRHQAFWKGTPWLSATPTASWSRWSRRRSTW